MSHKILRATISAATPGVKTYATWNPSDKNAAITLSNGNMTAASSTATAQSVRSTIALEEGKSYYCELLWTSGTQIYFGVGNSSASLSAIPGANTNSWAIAGTGNKWHNGSSAAYTSAASNGDVLGMSLKWNQDTSTWDIYFRTSNTVMSSTAAYTGLSGTLYLMVGATVAFEATVYTGEDGFQQDLPDGVQPGVWTQAADTAQTLYFASESFVDFDNMRLYEGRIAPESNPSVNRQVSVWPWGAANQRASIGELILNNQDGALDYCKNLIVRDKEIILEYILNTNIHAASPVWILFARGIVDSFVFNSNGTVRVVIGDTMTLVDKPITDKFYETWASVEAIAGKAKPVCIGTAYSVDPVLIEEDLLYFDVHDDAITGVDAVYDRADIDSVGTDYTLRSNGFDKVHTPAGRMTADIRGSLKIGSSLFTEPFTSWSAGAYDNNPTSWTVTNETGINERIYERTSGHCAFLKSGGGSSLYMERNVGFVAGTTYVIEIDVTYYQTASNLLFFTSNGAGTTEVINFTVDDSTRSGVHKFVVTPTSGQTHLRLLMPASSTGLVEIGYININAATHIRYLPDVLNHILVDRGGLSTGNIDSASFTALNNEVPYDLGMYFREGAKIRDVLTEIMNSFCGWIVPNEAGELTVGRLKAPSITPVLSLTPQYLLDDMTCTLDRAPNLSTTIGARRNWVRLSDNDFAGSVLPQDRERLKAQFQFTKQFQGAVHQTYVHADNNAEKGTYLVNEADCANEAERLAMLYSQERFFYSVTAIDADNVATSTTLELTLGDTINVTFPRFDLANGKNLIVIGVEKFFKSRAVRLTLWG